MPMALPTIPTIAIKFRSVAASATSIDGNVAEGGDAPIKKMRILRLCRIRIFLLKH